MINDKENLMIDQQKEFLISLVDRFQLEKYFESDILDEKKPGDNYIAIIEAIIKREWNQDFQKFGFEEDFQAMFAFVLGDETLFNYFHCDDPYYNHFLPNRFTVQICKSIIYNKKIRKVIGLEPYTRNEWEKCRDRDIKKIIQYSINMLISYGLEKESIVLEEIENITLIRTIREYYKFADDRYLLETTKSLIKSSNSIGKPLDEHGWFTGSSSLPIYFQFLSCCYLIDHIFESSSQWGLLQNKSRKSSLAKLIDIGSSLWEDVNFFLLQGTNTNLYLVEEIKWTRSKYIQQALIASLFLEKKQDEIYSLCSKLENPVIMKHLYVSSFIKKILYLSSGCYHLSAVFDKTSNEFPNHQYVNNTLYPLYSSNISVNSSISDSAYGMKNYLISELRKIPEKGAIGVIERRIKYKERKFKHHELYMKLGIETSIPRESSGRRIEILFPHPNKNLKNIGKEIEHLPYSLNKIVSDLENLNSILIMPYIVLVTYDHLFQFSRCIYSTSVQGFEDSWKLLLKEIRRIVKIFRSQYLGEGELENQFLWCIVGIMNKLVEIVEKDGDEINRGDVIRFQKEIKDSFLQGYPEASNWLEFPDIFELLRDSGKIELLEWGVF